MGMKTVANGHSDDSWIGVLRELLPHAIGFLTWFCSTIVAVAMWFAYDRWKTLALIAAHRRELDELWLEIDRLDSMEEYPNHLTSRRIRQLKNQFENARRRLDVATRQEVRG